MPQILVLSSDPDHGERYRKLVSRVDPAVTMLADIEELAEQILLPSFKLILAVIQNDHDHVVRYVENILLSYPAIPIITFILKSNLELAIDLYRNGVCLVLEEPTSTGTILAACQKYIEVQRDNQRPANLIQIDLGLSQIFGIRGRSKCSASEISTLNAFAMSPTRRLETWQIGQFISGDADDLPTKNAIHVYIHRLNERIRAVIFHQKPIHAVRNFGFELNREVLIRILS